MRLLLLCSTFIFSLLTLSCKDQGQPIVGITEKISFPGVEGSPIQYMYDIKVVPIPNKKVEIKNIWVDKIQLEMQKKEMVNDTLYISAFYQRNTGFDEHKGIYPESTKVCPENYTQRAVIEFTLSNKDSNKKSSKIEGYVGVPIEKTERIHHP